MNTENKIMKSKLIPTTLIAAFCLVVIASPCAHAADKSKAAPAVKALPTAKPVAKATPKPTAGVPKNEKGEERPKTALKRLDPHGAPDADLKKIDINVQTQCKVCHFGKGAGKIGTKPEPENLCAACHGRLLHGGLVEHMGEEPGGGAGLNCLSCHRPHRATLDGSQPTTPKSQSVLKLNTPNLPEGLIEQSKPGVMIDHPCSECHSW